MALQVITSKHSTNMSAKQLRYVTLSRLYVSLCEYINRTVTTLSTIIFTFNLVIWQTDGRTDGWRQRKVLTDCRWPRAGHT